MTKWNGKKPTSLPSRDVLERRLLEAQAKALESIYDMTGERWVDPNQRFYDDETGERWEQIGMADSRKRAIPYTSEAELKDIRDQCRSLAVNNEFAINGHENRINYIVGSGHSYTATAKDEEQDDKGKQQSGEKLVAQLQKFIDEWIDENRWHHRQQEIVRRRDRDGECFLRFFDGPDGMMRVRFVEPGMVTSPDMATNPNADFGILTDAEDVETVLAYWIGGEKVPADMIQHRKANVDMNAKRGLPLFYPCRRDLARAEVIQKNMAVMSTILSAIAMVRKHEAATQSQVQAMIQANASVQTKHPDTDATVYHRRFMPGTILDAYGGMEYDFPSAKVNPAAFVAPRDAILRSIASRLVIPEFMLTSDASNANYSSTMVAEGPAVKMFNRLQWDMIVNDLEVLKRAIGVAVAAGKLPEAALTDCDIDVEPSRLEAQNRKEEVEADTMLVREKIMSKHTARLRHDLDPKKEEQYMDEENEKAMENSPFAGLDDFGQGNRGQNQSQNDQSDASGKVSADSMGIV